MCQGHQHSVSQAWFLHHWEWMWWVTLWSSLSILNSIQSCFTRKPDESSPSSKEMSWHLTNHKQWSQVQLIKYPTRVIHMNVIYQQHSPFVITRYNTNFLTAKPGNFGTHLYAGNIKVAKRVLSQHNFVGKLQDFHFTMLRKPGKLMN